MRCCVYFVFIPSYHGLKRDGKRQCKHLMEIFRINSSLLKNSRFQIIPNCLKTFWIYEEEELLATISIRPEGEDVSMWGISADVTNDTAPETPQLQNTREDLISFRFSADIKSRYHFSVMHWGGYYLKQASQMDFMVQESWVTLNFKNKYNLYLTPLSGINGKYLPQLIDHLISRTSHNYPSERRNPHPSHPLLRL